LGEGERGRQAGREEELEVRFFQGKHNERRPSLSLSLPQGRIEKRSPIIMYL
jgi:hypothetical protein